VKGNRTNRRHVEPMILLDLPAIRRKLDAGPDRYTLTETAALFGISRQGLYHTRGLVLPPRDRRRWTRDEVWSIAVERNRLAREQHRRLGFDPRAPADGEIDPSQHPELWCDRRVVLTMLARYGVTP
jgi:hypothetical protein